MVSVFFKVPFREHRENLLAKFVRHSCKISHVWCV